MDFSWLKSQDRNLGVAVIAVMVPLIAALYFFLPAGNNQSGPLAAFVSSIGSTRRLPIYSVATDKKVAAISFDAAWGADKTYQILDILDEYNVKTTFFLVTFWVEKYPEEAREIVARGHEIGLHSSTHPDFTALTAANMREELRQNYEVVERETGFQARLFRPPFGAYDDRVLEVVEDELDFYTIQWSIDSLDWKDVSADFIAGRIVDRMHPGAIVLFHNNAENTPAALPHILRALQAEQWSIVPISKLLHRGPYTVDHEGRQVPAGSAGNGER